MYIAQEEQVGTMVKTIKKYAFILIGLVAAVFVSFNLLEDNKAGNILVIQSLTGELKVVNASGPTWQGFGKVTQYKQSNQFWFSKNDDEGNDTDQSIKVRFNDGGHAQISGSVRWNMPTASNDVLRLHNAYQNQNNIEQQLIKQTLTKAVYMTGPVMSSQESYAAKRNDLLSYIEDQAAEGVYRTHSQDVKIKDEFTGAEKTVTNVTIVERNGKLIRQEVSPIRKYAITLTGLALNSIDYDPIVEKQIQAQQKATMQVQTAIANSKKAEQDALTTELQGKANAASAKWAQEVIKSKLVTQAESDKAVATLAVQTATLNKQRDILEGEGIAAKKRLVMQADGALTQKLETYERVQKFWSLAFSSYQGNLVPTYVSGGGSTGNAGFNFMELMSAKAARDLGLDLSNK